MTEEERAGLELLIERRPEWQEGLKSAAAVDDLLADACGSYAAAKRGLEHWRRQSGADAPDRVAEYEEHLFTIEHDIAQRLTCNRQEKGNAELRHLQFSGRQKKPGLLAELQRVWARVVRRFG